MSTDWMHRLPLYRWLVDENAQQKERIAALETEISARVAGQRSDHERIAALEAENAGGIAQAVASVVVRDLAADDKKRLAALDAAARAVMGGLYKPSSWTFDAGDMVQNCRACGFRRGNAHGSDCPVGALDALLEEKP